MDAINEAQQDKYVYYRRVMFFSLIVACIITVPFVIVEWIKTGHPIFLYYGDYNAQQISFYKHCVDAVRSGAVFWDWTTDIGSNFVGSYSYYMLGSPFFWILTLFPAEWTPYLMGPMFIVKYVVAAVTSFAYLQRFVKNKNYAVIGGILYAFCGFQIYNTFFNQFHEVVALFPLLPLGMEELVNNNRRGLFAVAVALNAMCNYFMFAGQVAFCIFYFLFRFMTRDFAITLKKFALLAFEAVVGVLIAMCLFLPGGLALVGNNRVSRHFDGAKPLNMFVYMSSNHPYWYRYGHILESMFFPPDIPSRTNFFYGHSERWSSNAMYIPMFGLTGLFALLRTRKYRTWVKAFCIFLTVCMFVPILNSSFFLLNSSYYARWIYMLVMMLVLATVLALDRQDSRWKGAILTYLAASAAIFVPIGLRWYDDVKTDKIEFTLGSAPFPERLWICVVIVLISCGLMWYLFTKLRGKPGFDRAVLLSVCCITVLYSATHITHGKCHSYSSDFMVDQAINGQVELDDADFFRIDFYRDSSTSTIDNLGIFWDYPSIECFHTVVPPSVMNFYPKIGVTRDVGSRAETSVFGLRGMASVKYSFVTTSKSSKNDIDGWAYYDTQAGFDIYVNENYIEPGFYYTEFMTETQFEKVPKADRHALLCTYLVVPDEDAAYYSRFMTEVKYKDDLFRKATYSTYTASVAERRECTADSFEYNSRSFHSTITLDSPEIVFFSVPRDDAVSFELFGKSISLGGGWSAKVNGRSVNICDVTYGFMAVECDAGYNEIEFTYIAPGLELGFAITILGIVLLAAYLLISRAKGERASYRFFAESYYCEEVPAKKAADETEGAFETENATESDDETEASAEGEVTAQAGDATEGEDIAQAEDAPESEDSAEGDVPSEADDIAETNDATEASPETEASSEADNTPQPEKRRREFPQWGWYIVSGLFVAAVLAFVLIIMYFTNNH